MENPFSADEIGMSSRVDDLPEALPDSCTLNVEEIDAQHEDLIRLVNELGAALAARGPERIVKPLLSKLLEHTLIHFGTEQRLMVDNGYPNAASHTLEHKRLIGELTRIKAGYDKAHVPIPSDLISFLGHWLIDHIEHEDRQLAAFLNQYGIR